MATKQKASVTPDRSSTQLEDLVFNVYGHAYAHGLKNRTPYTVLTAHSESSTTYSKRLTDLEQEELSAPRLSNQPLIPFIQGTEREQEVLDSSDHGRFLLVGLVLQNLDREIYFRSAKDLKRGKPVGLSRPEEIIVADSDTPALRVVTPITTLEPEGGCKLYVLIDQKDDLCHPFTVAQKEVFYFAEFRDDSSTVDNRKKGWNRRVLDHSVQSSRGKSGDAVLTSKSHLRQARDTTKIVVEATQSFSNDLAALVSTLAISKDRETLNQLRTLLHLADKDLKHRPVLPENACLHAFVRPKQVFTLDHAKGLIKEASKQWPELEPELVPEDILRLREGLVSSGVALEYRLLRGFLAHGSREVRSAGPDADMAELVRKARDTVSVIIGAAQGPKRASISIDANDAFLQAVIEKMEQLHEMMLKQKKGIKDLAGDQATNGTIADIWDAYKSAVDVDSVKLAFEQAIRHVAGRMAEETMVDETMADLITIMKRWYMASKE